jgi:hypothetical protein
MSLRFVIAATYVVAGCRTRACNGRPLRHAAARPSRLPLPPNPLCRLQSIIFAYFELSTVLTCGVILTLSSSGMGMEVVTALISKFGGIFWGLVE